MAKILILYVQPILENNPNNLICYYEGLIKELNRYGNSTLRINLIHKYNKYELNYKIKQFSPDLIFSFNNQIIEDFIKITNCPVVLFDADSIDRFDNLELIKKYQDRYYMVTSYAGWDSRYSEFGFTKNKICTIHPATAIQSVKSDKNKNISFIGSNFNFENYNLIDFINSDKDRVIYNALKHFWKNNNYNYKLYFEELCQKGYLNIFDLHLIFDSRIYILSSILDLGLNLYGTGWENLTKTNYALASAYIQEAKYSLKHNQDIYNTSKINLSISHPQANGYAFPWRIYDIMASDGMLISTRADLLKKYTKGIVDIPMYDSPYDARNLCIKYLKENSLREDIVAASNEFIEKFGRWKDNFEILESFLGIKLIQQNQQYNLGKDSFINININKLKKHNEHYKQIKNITNGIFLILSNLPIIENYFPQKSKRKLYRSIEKNKRL